VINGFTIYFHKVVQFFGIWFSLSFEDPARLTVLTLRVFVGFILIHLKATAGKPQVRLLVINFLVSFGISTILVFINIVVICSGHLRQVCLLVDTRCRFILDRSYLAALKRHGHRLLVMIVRRRRVLILLLSLREIV
jgi:hypothetical protein